MDCISSAAIVQQQQQQQQQHLLWPMAHRLKVPVAAIGLAIAL
jgi:hypothetical protein